jgi:uncharacterized membrane protein YbaN (DUF454 family)
LQPILIRLPCIPNTSVSIMDSIVTGGCFHRNSQRLKLIIQNNSQFKWSIRRWPNYIAFLIIGHMIYS